MGDGRGGRAGKEPEGEVPTGEVSAAEVRTGVGQQGERSTGAGRRSERSAGDEPVAGPGPGVGSVVEPTSGEVVDRVRRLAGHEALLVAELDLVVGVDGGYLTEHELLEDVAAAVEKHLGELLDRGLHRLLARFDDVRDALVAAIDGVGTGLRVAVHAFPAATASARALAPAGRGWPPDEAVAEVTSVVRLAHRGQVLATTATWHAVYDAVPRRASLAAAGHWVRDARQEPRRLFSLQHPSLMSDLPAVLPEQLPPGELPEYSTHLFGRSDELGSLLSRLLSGRVVCLAGAPGTGKTRLAVELAGRVGAEAFSDGVRFCDASTVVGAGDLVERLAAVFERPAAAAHEWTTRRMPGQAPGDLRSQLMSTLKGRFLLVLDGCDRLGRDAWELIAEMVGHGEATVIATVRTPTYIPRQDVVWLEPVGGGDDPATRLVADLVERLGATRDEARALAAPAAWAVVAPVVAVPLALELVVPLLHTVGPVEVVRRLEAVVPPVGQPQEVLAAAVDLAIGALADDHVRLLTALAPFGGTVGLEAAEAVAPTVGVTPADVATMLTTLARHALVRVEVTSRGGAARYRMLDAVRDRVAYQHAGFLTEAAAREAHAGHFLDLVRRSQAARRTPREPAWVRVVEVEFDNIRAAHRWFVDAGRFDDAFELLWCLADDVVLRLRHEIGHWAEALGTDPRTVGHPRRGAALALAGNTAFVEGRLDRAFELTGLALAAMEGGPEADGRWIALNTAALCAAGRDDEPAAKDLFAQVVAPGGQRHSDPLAVVSGLYQGVLLLWLVGKPAEGARLAGWLRSVPVESPSLEAMVILAQGLAFADEDPERARIELERGMRMASAARSPLLYLHGWRGVHLLALPSEDRRHRARRLLSVADEFRKRDNTSEYVQTLVDVAWHAFRAGEHELAATIGGYVSQTQYRYVERLRLLARELRAPARQPLVSPAWDAGTTMTLDDLDAHVHWVVGEWGDAG